MNKTCNYEILSFDELFKKISEKEKKNSKALFRNLTVEEKCNLLVDLELNDSNSVKFLDDEKIESFSHKKRKSSDRFGHSYTYIENFYADISEYESNMDIWYGDDYDEEQNDYKNNQNNVDDESETIKMELMKKVKKDNKWKIS